MTEEQWAIELADHLRDTDWVPERSGITRIHQLCLARVRSSATHLARHLCVSGQDCGNPSSRKAEILRQLFQ
jgi:hypothetical protein